MPPKMYSQVYIYTIYDECLCQGIHFVSSNFMENSNYCSLVFEILFLYANP